MAWSAPSDSAPNLNTGSVSIGTSFSAIDTHDPLWLLGINVTNIHATLSGKLTVTDTAGNPILYQIDISPGFPLVLAWAFMPMAGAKWICDRTATLVGRAWGRF